MEDYSKGIKENVLSYIIIEGKKLYKHLLELGLQKSIEILMEKVYTIVAINYGETEDQMLAARTDKQKNS